MSMHTCTRMNSYAYNNNTYHNSYAQVPGFNEGFKVHHRHRCVPQDHRLHLQPRTRRELCAHVSGTAGRRVVLFKTWYVVGCAVRRLLSCNHLALSSRTSCDLPSLPSNALTLGTTPPVKDEGRLRQHRCQRRPCCRDRLWCQEQPHATLLLRCPRFDAGLAATSQSRRYSVHRHEVARRQARQGI